eukprot:scaffold53061_cov54-Phaeocystis_antarctica.AAC.3
MAPPHAAAGAGHEVDPRRAADLHHLRGRRGHRRLGRRQPAVGQGAQDAARARAVVTRRPLAHLLHAAVRGAHPRTSPHISAHLRRSTHE